MHVPSDRGKPAGTLILDPAESEGARLGIKSGFHLLDSLPQQRVRLRALLTVALRSTAVDYLASRVGSICATGSLLNLCSKSQALTVLGLRRDAGKQIHGLERRKKSTRFDRSRIIGGFPVGVKSGVT